MPKQLYKDLQSIVYAVGALDRLEYIRQTIWRCGQIDLYHGLHKNPGSLEAGLQLHFEYEVLKFVVLGGLVTIGDVVSHFEPESKELKRSTGTIALIISAVHNKHDGSRQLWFADKPLSTPLSNPAALVQELDEAIYLYCQAERSPLKVKEYQNGQNRSEETQYRRYKPRK